jgi:hypothetical protein
MRPRKKRIKPVKDQPINRPDEGVTKYVDAKGLLEALFDPSCRPTVRWVRDQQKARRIPFIKLGHFVLFDVPAVREALARNNTVMARAA